jgi:hypothetical protein
MVFSVMVLNSLKLVSFVHASLKTTQISVILWTKVVHLYLLYL